MLILKCYVFMFFPYRKKDETSSFTHLNLFHLCYWFLNFEYSVLRYVDILSFYVLKPITLSFRFCFPSYS